jgi:hypothetical protein
MATVEEIAWAAGLFEGEGCIYMVQQKAKVLRSIRLSVLMTDRDIVQRFRDVVDCGSVSGERRFGREHHKPTYVWLICNRRDVERILLDFLPWLGERRTAKANEALAEIAKLNQTCEGCGIVFRSHRITSRFCSVKCRNRWHYLSHRPAEPSPTGRPRTLTA